MTGALYRSDVLRHLEQAHAAAEPPLMQRAGAAAAALAQRLAPDGCIHILAGPGNNGGDARVMSARLRQAGRDVRLWEGGPLPEGRPALTVDGLFGIGLARPLAGPWAEAVAHINAAPGAVLALDVPSGLDADTGRCLGPTVRASHTLSFLGDKPGLHTLDGPDHAGTVIVEPLGLALPASPGQLLDRAAFATCLVPRRRNSHKGSHGTVAVLGGAPGMAGAALLAGRAALRLGAGRVCVGMLDPLAVDPLQPELMLRAWPGALAQATVVVAGPGLGQSTTALDLLQAALEAPLPLVLDADALNLLAAHPVLATRAARRSAPTLLTPHPAEAARLLGEDTATVQQDRIASALALAARFAAPVALKGCGTLIAAGPRWWINPNGNPGLASGGSGDVLAGMIGALLAQGWPPLAALLGGVHLHGAAADDRVAGGDGPVGLAAGELIDAARARLNRWIRGD